MTLPTTPSFRLDGKRCLVVGASRGLGLGCAMALAEAGGHVVLAARGAQDLHDVVAEMRREGLNADAYVVDVSDLAALDKMFQTVGPLDVVVNSAGTARHSHVLETTPDDFEAVMAVNLKAAYFVAQHAAKAMAGREGSIIQISSQMGLVGGPERAVYSASKHAVEGMTKAMAIDLGPQNIRVNTICPTFIRTPLSAVTFDDPQKRAWLESKIKLSRVGGIEDIMGACLFLATDAARLISGTAIVVDGGWTSG